MLIPSIDLMSNQAVQLEQGQKKIIARDDVLALTKKFALLSDIAVIDLDAALNQGNNHQLIAQILQITSARVGGGIRTVEKAKELIDLGAAKVIIGSSVFQNKNINKELLTQLIAAIGRDKISIALDSINEEIVVDGWRQKTGLNLFETLPQLEDFCGEFLITCVEKEGLMQGTNLALYQRLRKLTPCKITAAGGISSLEEIQTLSKSEINVQLGMSLYTGKISLEDAFIATLRFDKGLIPTITIDEFGQVLMLAYMNIESLQQTLQKSQMHYYSRSRQEIWHKGSTSGSYQYLTKIRPDCDGDTLLAVVRQQKKACHQDSYSCFDQQNFTLKHLEKVIQQRLASGDQRSYTASLTKKRVREKIIEESQELVAAKNTEEIIWEAADVLYHLLTLINQEQIPLKTIENELLRRRQQ